MKSTTGGEIMAKEEVEKVFGIIDATYFGLYSNLKKFGIELISPGHEACALHMAGAYACLIGMLSVAIASNGPGVANALSGVAVENGEGNRVLLITSTRRTGIGNPDRGCNDQYFLCYRPVRCCRIKNSKPSWDMHPLKILRKSLRIILR